MGSYFFLPREAWKAAPAKGAYIPHTPFSIVVHHSAIPNVSHYKGISTVQEIQRAHQIHRVFIDIGYHFLVGPDGVVYEGRPIFAEGAHVRYHNSGRIGICLIGDYRKEQDSLPAPGIRALVSLCRYLLRSFHLSWQGVWGHKDLDPGTECPGEVLYSFLPVLRRELELPDQGVESG